MTGIRSSAWTLLACCLLQGCSPERAEDTTAKVAGNPAPMTITAPCNLLTDADIRAVVPGASNGKVDAGDADHGIYSCTWDTPGGRVWLQAYRSGPASVGTNIRGLAAGLFDPKETVPLDKVRIEILPKIGDGAMAFVEKADSAKGIRTSNAVLVTRHGKYMATLFAPELALGDRATALHGLETLGTQLANRL